MNPDVAKKWVDALRSGAYKGCKEQLGRNTLGKTQADNPQHFCCLGVLCKVYEKEHPKKVKGFEYFEQFLPEKVMKWAGMRDGLGTYGNCYHTLVHQNDGAKRGFKGIAKIIERHVKEL